MLATLPLNESGERQISSDRDFGTVTRVQDFAVRYQFAVVFTAGLFDPGNPVLADVLRRIEPDKRHRCIAFIDEGVLAARPGLFADLTAYANAYAVHIDLIPTPIIVAGGEAVKIDVQFVERMQLELLEHHIDRHSYVIAIGGGAMLDAVGLVAATTHRGVRLVRVPTTVLAQNDSGVGVKNGVNFHGQKNFVGTFAPPFAVLNDLDFLDTLPPRERRSGVAEAVKVALIRDADFFYWLERHADALAEFDRAATATMIRRCAELHMRQIGQGGDPFESGSARPLDFGHWSAHRLETLSRYQIRHGEAVATGIALDTRYSVLAGLLAQGMEDRVCALLERLGFDLWHEELGSRTTTDEHAVLSGLRDFREHLGGDLTITLLAEIGVGVEVHEMDETRILQSIDWIKTRTMR